MAKVSVILTSYNHAKFLRESIDSVLKQTYPDFELIIADDASTDNSWEIIKSYSDPRITSYRNVTNQRGFKSEAFPQATLGEYIAIHHSDDVWEADKLEKQVAFLDANPEIAAVFTHASIIDEDGNPFRNEDHPYYRVFDQPNRSRYEWLRYFFYHGNGLCHPSILIRKEYIDVYESFHGIIQLPDFESWIRLCLRSEIYVIPEKLVRFRVRDNEGNTSGNRQDTRIRIQFELLQLLNFYRSISTVELLVRIFPEAVKYINDQHPDVLFALGMLAVEKGSNQVTNLFGLTLLFEALNDPQRARDLKKFNNFGEKDFVILTGKYDVFSVETVSNLNLIIAEERANAEQAGQKLEMELATEKANAEQAIQKLEIELAMEKADAEQTVQNLRKNFLTEQAVSKSRINSLEQKIEDFSREFAEKAEVYESEQKRLNEKNSQLEQEKVLVESQKAELEKAFAFAKKEIVDYYTSTSWKMTRPFRWISKKLRG
jgi:glycosyltransferase involved in cell wall biosynthesis